MKQVVGIVMDQEMGELTQVAFDMILSERLEDWSLRELCFGLEITSPRSFGDGAGMGSNIGTGSGRGEGSGGGDTCLSVLPLYYEGLNMMAVASSSYGPQVVQRYTGSGGGRAGGWGTSQGNGIGAGSGETCGNVDCSGTGCGTRRGQGDDDGSGEG